ncbi:nucleotide exchange factor GrpE [Archangium lipolyticum]|uniref:nucleotide exchange factor GrpE n=1 Tax=Archangium lipolyticum TaxID=2970465 RepID=UPI00214A2860|nr:nucleotide exchange factor GrpE [Archangium lipolyticum]
MADSNRDEKGSFQTHISQDVIDAALKSVERRAETPPPEEDEASLGGRTQEVEFPEGGRTLDVELPEGGMTLEVDMPPSVFEEPSTRSDDTFALATALEQTRRELAEARQQLEQSQRELGETRQQLEFSQSKGREMMERLKDSHERGLRATADLENYKKRAQKEKEEVQKFGSERLLKDFLPVVDNLDRALEAAQKSSDFESLRTGVEMTRKLFDSAFGKHGVKGFSAVGQPFDPRLHEAMQQVESAAVPSGHVLYEAVRGYMLNERLMRPALVVVARAPENAPPAPEPTSSSATPEGEPTGGTTTAKPGTTPSGSQ